MGSVFPGTGIAGILLQGSQYLGSTNSIIYVQILSILNNFVVQYGFEQYSGNLESIKFIIKYLLI